MSTILSSGSTSNLDALAVVGAADFGTPTYSGVAMGRMVLGTSQNTTSGTSIDFTSIPSWAKRITVMFSGVSTNGTSNIQLQIGNGSIVTSGYLSGCIQAAGGGTVALATLGTGLYVASPTAATAAFRGVGSLVLLSAATNTWCWSSTVADGINDRDYACSGDKSLAGTLDRIRLTTVNGTDTFDAGSVNILYEG